MTVAEAMELSILVIIRSHAFLFRPTGLGCPEIHAVRNQHSRQGLSEFLCFLAKESCGLGNARRSSRERIDALKDAVHPLLFKPMRTPLLDVLPVIIRRFEGRFILKAENLIVLHFLFVMQEFHDDMSLGITVEDYLQVGTHGQNLVHQVGNSVEETYERKQMIETGVMAKAQGGCGSPRSYHTVGCLHDILP